MASMQSSQEVSNPSPPDSVHVIIAQMIGNMLRGCGRGQAPGDDIQERSSLLSVELESMCCVAGHERFVTANQDGCDCSRLQVVVLLALTLEP